MPQNSRNGARGYSRMIGRASSGIPERCSCAFGGPWRMILAMQEILSKTDNPKAPLRPVEEFSNTSNVYMSLETDAYFCYTISI